MHLCLQVSVLCRVTQRVRVRSYQLATGINLDTTITSSSPLCSCIKASDIMLSVALEGSVTRYVHRLPRRCLSTVTLCLCTCLVLADDHSLFPSETVPVCFLLDFVCSASHPSFYSSSSNTPVSLSTSSHTEEHQISCHLCVTGPAQQACSFFG
jgi:hypothetical protein